MSPDGRRFVFAPLEQRGVVAGLRVGQIALLGTGLVVATALLRAAPDLAGVGTGVLILLLSTAAAFVPVAGRPVEQWAPTVGRRAVRLITGRLRTTPVSRSRRRPSAGPRMLGTAPACFAGLTFGEVDQPGGTPVGVIADAATGALTAVLAVRGRSFTLLDETDKERRLASWASVMAGLSREGGAVRSLQWVERTVPGDAGALVRHLDRAGALPPGDPAVASYRELVSAAGPLGQDHECLVALTIRAPRRRGATRPGATLLRELRLLEGQLRGAEIDLDCTLTRRGLGAILQTAFDPWARSAIRRRADRHPDLPGPEPAAAWPCATEESWGWWRTDDAWHATFWVAEWPRSEVGPDFLGGLLLHAGVQRSISVLMAPLTPSAGVREAEAARTAQAADDQLRARAGFLTTARRRRQAEGVAQRESELSDGHAAYRFSGYVTVTARSPDELEIAAGEIVHAAHQSRMDLRRLYGVQDLAFTWTLPLGRGLAGR